MTSPRFPPLIFSIVLLVPGVAGASRWKLGTSALEDSTLPQPHTHAFEALPQTTPVVLELLQEMPVEDGVEAAEL